MVRLKAMIDDPSRGISYRQDGPLDQRMDPSRGVTLAERLLTADADEVAKVLRDGLMAMVKDPEFMAETRKAKLDVEPASHTELEAVARRTLQVTDAVRGKVRAIFKP